MIDSNDSLMIIDDEKDVRDSLEQLFSIQGFSVTALESAKEALKIISNDFNGVIISDIRMPEIDGLKFLSEVKKLDMGIIYKDTLERRDGVIKFLNRDFNLQWQKTETIDRLK